MKKIAIIGGGGMVGQKLAWSLNREGLGNEPLDITLLDLHFPPDGAPANAVISANVTDDDAITQLIDKRPDVIYHLAAIVSGEAEANFDLGWEVNMHAFWRFLETCRAAHSASGGTYRPKIVFTSSGAVFGGPYPDKIDDMFPPYPQTSYGAQKTISELMLTDFSRKGFVDGISIRLPTIAVRPGKPNKAASSFFSGIIREPLNGKEAILPVSPDVRHWMASPRSAVGFLRHAAELDLSKLGDRRGLNMPGISCTVAEQIEALREVAGDDAVKLIRSEPDETIIRIVDGWAREFVPERALALGFRADKDFKSIVEAYIADDLQA